MGSWVGAFAVAPPADFEGYPTWAVVQAALVLGWSRVSTPHPSRPAQP